MPAPRKSAEILKISGAFEINPNRTREDAPGAGPLDETPPEYLTGAQQAAWRELLTYLPRVALSQSERVGIVQMAKIWAALQDMHPTATDFKKLDDSLRNWCMQMGMTLQSRIKLGCGGKDKKPSTFAKLKDDAKRA